MTGNRCGFLGGNENILELDSGDGCTIIGIYEKLLNFTLN